MFVDFICDNKECEKYNVEETRMISYAQLGEQTCDCCGNLLTRVWNFSGAIKTADGFKVN